MRIKAYVKSMPIYWRLKRDQAIRAYARLISVLPDSYSISDSEGSASDTIMIFSSVGIFANHLTVDVLLAKELMRKGARVIVVLCDAQLPICQVSDRYSFAFSIGDKGRERRQENICKACVSSTRELVANLGITYAYFSDGLRQADQDLMTPSEVDVSDEIRSGYIRYAASSHTEELKNLPPDIHKKYVLAGDVALRAIEGLFNKYKPDTVIAHHGIYLPQGIVQRVAKDRKTVFYSWHFGYRKSTLIFSRGDTYHRELIADQPLAFEVGLDSFQRETILKYLSSRITGRQDWIHFNRSPKPFTSGNSRSRYFVFFTSVDWDAALHFPTSVFLSQFDFLDKLIEVFRSLPEVELLIRVHPAEVTGFHPAAVSIDNYFANVDCPKNVQVISARNKTSSYEIAKHCIAAIVYNTKLGLELPPVGIPVIVAGDCWMRGKGFSYDVCEADDLDHFIRLGAALKVTDSQREKALQFAYYFYFRRCIDTPELTSVSTKFHVAVSSQGIMRAKVNDSGFRFIVKSILATEQVIAPY